MTVTDGRQRQQYLDQTSPASRLMATKHPVLVFVPFVVLWLAGGVVTACFAPWWVGALVAAVSVPPLLTLRWNLCHRDEATRAVNLRVRAENAAYRKHPVTAVGSLALIGAAYVSVRLTLGRAGHREHHALWVVLLWAGIAALVGVGVGLVRLRRARRERPSQH
jgi:uncharacterized membrane protein YgcG